MSATAMALIGLAGASLVLLLWAIGRVVTLAGARVPPGDSQPCQYLAGRLDGVRITQVADLGDELLVSLATRDAGPLAGAFRVTAACSLARVWRWRVESTPLRAYLSRDGALMLADPALGGNAACEPLTAHPWPARQQAPPQDQSPAADK